MPLAFIIIGFLIFAFFVKIDEKAHARIVAKIEANLHDESDAAKYGEDIAKPRCSARSPQPGKPSNA